MSPAHYRRIFKNRCGASPRDVLSRHRLNYARNALLHGDLSITELAEYLGYESLFSFSGQFKKQFGKSPTAFRKQAGKASDSLTRKGD